MHARSRPCPALSLTRTAPLAALVVGSLVVGVPKLTAQGDAPRVVSMTPPNGADDVDPSKVTELVVEFDRAMQQGSHSWVGGGPTFPKIPDGQHPRWKNPKTCVLPVRLEHDHVYRLGLNSSTFRNFRSAKGVSLEPVSWSFTTIPSKPLNPREQRDLNERALDALFETLAAHYSYYDRVVTDWKKLRRKHEQSIVGAKSTRAWATKVGETLAAAQDLHLWLDVGSGDSASRIGTGTRAVDPLFRKQLLAKRVEGKQLGNLAFAGRLRDEPRIGYLVLAGWTQRLDLDGVEHALAKMHDHVDALVIDVRPNSGGDELLAQRIASWFLGPEEVVYAKNRYRTGPGENGFGRVLDRTIRGRDSGRVEMPVAVLTSRYVMSSCEAFVLMMRQAPNCVTVGQPTYGSSGNPKPHALPNGVTVYLPSWQALRPDGTCFEGEGIAPDIVVDAKPEELDRGVDPILDRAVQELKSRLKN
jgi:hypothetical protein